jgi:D-xylose reductase
MVDFNKTINCYIDLNNGLKMPRLGLGTYAVKELKNIVYESIKSGILLIDTAWFYKNEKEIGEGIKRALEDGLVKREELFIVTKVWPSHKHNPEESLKESLDNLGLVYVDLFLDHWPYNTFYDKVTDKETEPLPLHLFWPKMEELVYKGLAKSIGVSNYNVQLLSELLSSASIKPVVNQFELHPYLTQRDLVNYCNEQNICVMAFKSICRNEEVNLLEDPDFKAFADKYNISPGIFALNWALSQNAVVIPSTSNPERMKCNLEALNFTISDFVIKEMHEIMNKNFRLIKPQGGKWTKGIDIFA